MRRRSPMRNDVVDPGSETAAFNVPHVQFDRTVGLRTVGDRERTALAVFQHHIQVLTRQPLERRFAVVRQQAQADHIRCEPPLVIHTHIQLATRDVFHRRHFARLQQQVARPAPPDTTAPHDAPAHWRSSATGGLNGYSQRPCSNVALQLPHTPARQEYGNATPARCAASSTVSPGSHRKWWPDGLRVTVGTRHIVAVMRADNNAGSTPRNQR
jgi:hypothetical protein